MSERLSPLMYPDNNLPRPIYDEHGWKAIEEQLVRAKSQRVDPLTLVEIEDALRAIDRRTRD